MKQIIININNFEERAALLEDGALFEIFIQRNEKNRINGNIYKARIANVLPGMDSAFLDIGLEKNAFLHIQDFKKFGSSPKNFIGGNTQPIEELLKKGDEVIVQVLKEPRGDKGARVTTHYTIPGKYMVLMPNNDHIAISQKIKDPAERERLEKLVNAIKPKGIGIIIRTAANNKNNLQLENDIKYLVKKWENIEKKFKKSKVGEVLYRDKDVVSRTVRDVFSSDIEELIIDDEEKYWDIVEYTKSFSDNTFKTKIKLFQSSLHIFDYYGVTKGLEEALNNKVWLPCGGYLVIQKTEALVSIDVNTGKNTGINSLETTVVETNIEAAIEIARQLRIRNLSGIIIVDFIDMKTEKDKLEVLSTFDKHLKKDRIKNNIIHFTDLGLVEMTRKRQGTPLASYYQEPCSYCNGSGVVKSKENIVLDILKEIKELAEEKDIQKIILSVGKEIDQFIRKSYIDFIIEYLSIRKKEFILKMCKNKAKNNYEITMER